MKKFLIILSIFITSIIIVSCQSSVTNRNSNDVNGEAKAKEKIKIVATIYPEYDFVKSIIKGNEDKFDVKLLLTSGIDIHNFTPSAKDILDVGKSDLFIYVGGESDKWVEGVIRQATNDNLETINLLELLKGKIKVEELKEGMENDDYHHDKDDEHDEENEEEHEKEHEEEIEYDEHVWLSLNNAKLIYESIGKEIIKLDSENASLYKENIDSFVSELEMLDKEYKDAIDNSKRKLLLFADRFPFRYLVDDYGIDYYAAFKGCSAETEASFETIKFLSDKLSTEKLPYIIIIERSDDKIARAVIENSTEKDTKVETMYSMQSVNSEDILNGASYLSFMKKNLDVLKKALN